MVAAPGVPEVKTLSRHMAASATSAFWYVMSVWKDVIAAQHDDYAAYGACFGLALRLVQYVLPTSLSDFKAQYHVFIMGFCLDIICLNSIVIVAVIIIGFLFKRHSHCHWVSV